MVKQVRIYLTLKQETRDLLDDWAKQQGRSSTNLANWIVEERIKNAIKSGEFTPEKNQRSDLLNAALAFIKAIASGDEVEDRTIEALSESLDISTDKLNEMIKK